MDSPIIFYTFNAAGLILSLATLAVIVNALGKIGGMMRKGLLALLKGFILVVLSFLWTLSFRENACAFANTEYSGHSFVIRHGDDGLFGQ